MPAGGAACVGPAPHYWYDPLTVNATTDVNIVTNDYCMIADVHDFHVYTVEWTPTAITAIYDGQTCLVDNYGPYGTSPFDQPFFVALTQTLGTGSSAYLPGVTPLPATTEIDWVRVWK